MSEIISTGPFYTTQEAADYCGYSYDHFRKLANRFHVPRRGPGKSRFAASDLDAWMANEYAFCNVPVRETVNRTYNPFQI